PRAQKRKKTCAPSNTTPAIPAPLLRGSGKRTPRLSHMSPTTQQPPAATTAVATPVVRPPLVVLVALLSGVVLNVVWPLPFVPHALRLPVGCLLVVMAVVLFSYSVRRFRIAGTPVPGHQPATAI